MENGALTTEESIMATSGGDTSAEHVAEERAPSPTPPTTTTSEGDIGGPVVVKKLDSAGVSPTSEKAGGGDAVVSGAEGWFLTLVTC